MNCAKACFEVARTTKWTRKPVDSAEITALADKLYEIAKGEVSAELEIDLPLITRAVRYLGQVHAVPPRTTIQDGLRHAPRRPGDMAHL
jgi:hypothetical protein